MLAAAGRADPRHGSGDALTRSPPGVAWARWDGERLLLSVYVQPRAGRDEVVGTHGDRLKVRVRAAPVDDAANRALTALLARAFGVPRSGVSIRTGATSRRKAVAVERPRRMPDWLPAGAGRGG